MPSRNLPARQCTCLPSHAKELPARNNKTGWNPNEKRQDTAPATSPPNRTMRLWPGGPALGAAGGGPCPDFTATMPWRWRWISGVGHHLHGKPTALKVFPIKSQVGMSETRKSPHEAGFMLAITDRGYRTDFDIMEMWESRCVPQ